MYFNNSVAVLKEQLERVREESRATEAGSRARAEVIAKYKMEHGQVCRLLRLCLLVFSPQKMRPSAQSTTSVLAQVCMSTENLYSRCLEHSKVAHTVQLDPLMQLDIIGFYIGDLHAAIQKQL